MACGSESRGVEERNLWLKDNGACIAGWDVSNEVQSRYKEFKEMANVLDNGSEVFKLERGHLDHNVRTWVAIRLGMKHEWLLEGSDSKGRLHLLDFVLGASPDQPDETISPGADEDRA